MPRQPRVCAVCSTASAKYACPKCRAAYCCVACCREHKARCPGPSTAQKQQRKRPAVRTKDEFDDEDHALGADLKRRVDALTYVQAALDDDRDLLDALHAVDTAPSRSAALARARTTDLKLAAFIDRILLDLHVCERDPLSNDVSFLGLPPHR
mmetsp:Transcript_14038/g.42454  ORF Transcript_14038/g.42454 Transcript_14038/m.42454 type:complete len:153 (+) Transcript_14038:77-535(+)